MMNWKQWSMLCVVLLICISALAGMALPVAATATQPATEPTTEAGEPDLAAMGLVLGIGAVLLIITWAMVIWLMRRFVR